jgi:hypothetical protein
MNNLICINKEELEKRIEELEAEDKSVYHREESSAIQGKIYVLQEILNSSTITAQEIFDAARERKSFSLDDIPLVVKVGYNYKNLKEYIQNREK